MLRFYPLFLLAISLFLGCTVIGFFGEDAVDSCYINDSRPENRKCEDGIWKYSCGNDYYDSKIHFCFDNTLFDKCGGNDYNPSDQKCESGIIFNKCRNSYYNPEIQFCFEQDTKIYDKCGGKIYNPLSMEQICENDTLKTKCGEDYYDSIVQFCHDDEIYSKSEGLIIDNRDDKTYRYVVIGTQIWMAENLQHETVNTKCYDDNPDNCKFFGILYDWNAAKTVCPSGWHLPNDAEWNALRDFVGSSNVGTKLKANSDIWVSGKGTDSFGFTALPGGFYRDGFKQIREAAGFWSATAGSMAGSAHFRYFSCINETLGLDGFYTNNGWANVRCIKD